MDGLTTNHSHITCLLCGGLFLFPGPKYPLHLFTCHGVVEDSHRDYLVRASEYQMVHGELPEISHTEDMNISDMNDNHGVDVGESEQQDDGDDVIFRRVVLTPMKNRDPRLRRAQSTPRRNGNGEDDKSKDPDFALGKGKKGGGKHLCVTCGRHYANRTTLLKHRRQVCEREGKSEKIKCVTCGRSYASKDTLRKHQRLVCEASPLYQPRAGPLTSTPNPYNNDDGRRMTFGWDETIVMFRRIYFL